MRNQLSLITLLVANASLPREESDSLTEIIIGDWWDDVTGTVSDAASSVYNGAGDAYDYAVKYAKDHPELTKGLATQAGTAAGAALGGPVGGAIGGQVAGAAAGAAIGGHDVAKAAAQAAQQAAQQAAAQGLGLPPEIHASIHQAALNAFLHSAFAAQAIHLTDAASQGDEHAQATLAQAAHDASQGHQLAQTVVAVAYHAAPAVSSGYANALSTMLAWHH